MLRLRDRFRTSFYFTCKSSNSTRNIFTMQRDLQEAKAEVAELKETERAANADTEQQRLSRSLTSSVARYEFAPYIRSL